MSDPKNDFSAGIFLSLCAVVLITGALAIGMDIQAKSDDQLLAAIGHGDLVAVIRKLR